MIIASFLKILVYWNQLFSIDLNVDIMKTGGCDSVQLKLNFSMVKYFLIKGLPILNKYLIDDSVSPTQTIQP